MHTLRAAFGFFSRLPVGHCYGSSENPFQGVLKWIPVVGLVIGALAATLTWAATLVLPSLVCGVLACVIWESLTGGLHLDGVADCGDGLLPETPPERRLEIMKDSRLGTFGGAALFLTLLLKIAAMTALVQMRSPWLLMSAFIMAGVLSRSCIFLTLPYRTARPGGLGEAIRNGTRPWHAIPAIILVAVGCVLTPLHGLLAVVVAVVVTESLLVTARKRLGGVTGDVFGCLIETIEWLTLTIFCIRF